MTVTETAGVQYELDQAPAPAMPAEFAGTIGIQWPAVPPGANPAWPVVLPAYLTAFYDDDGFVPTVTRFALHGDATGLLWAELTMLADEDGKPVLHTGKGYEPAAVHGGEIAMGTFPFLITSMKVQGG